MIREQDRWDCDLIILDIFNFMFISYQLQSYQPGGYTHVKVYRDVPPKCVVFTKNPQTRVIFGKKKNPQKRLPFHQTCEKISAVFEAEKNPQNWVPICENFEKISYFLREKNPYILVRVSDLGPHTLRKLNPPHTPKSTPPPVTSHYRLDQILQDCVFLQIQSVSE